MPRLLARAPGASRRRVARAVALLSVAVVAGCSTRPAPPAPSPQRRAPNYGALEHDVLAELNRARSDPSGYARVLTARLPHYRGGLFRLPGDSLPTRTREGAAAAREAIAALEATAPLPTLGWSRGITLGARDHVQDQGPRGGMEHVGTDGSLPSHRVNRYGQWQRRVSENIAFGLVTGRDVVAALLIDDGIPDRGHRKNALDPAVRVAGVACGPHKTYRVMCVVVHAAGYVERSAVAGRK